MGAGRSAVCLGEYYPLALGSLHAYGEGQLAGRHEALRIGGGGYP